MKASVYYGKNDLRMEERPMPSIGAGEVLIRVEFCGICGTDIKKIQYGLANAPQVLGHEVTGVVVDSRALKFAIGDRLAVAHHVPCGECHYCRHGNVSMCAHFKSTTLDPGGYAEFCRIPAEHVAATAFKLESLSMEEGIFMEPLACVIRNLDMHALQSGDVAVVIGLGSIGLLSAQALAVRGVTVIGLDLKEDRLALAHSLGITHAIDGRNIEKIEDTIARLTDGRGVDIVIVTAGGPQLVPTYLKWLRSGGSLNLFASLFPEASTPLPLNEFYHREIQLTSAYSASPKALANAHHLLESGQVQVKDLITAVYPLFRLADGVAEMAAQQAMKILIAPSLG